MDVIGLRSHYQPDLLLSQHIQQVTDAMHGIWNWHSPQSLTPEIQEFCSKVCRFHDLGKTSIYFQEYIQDPETYEADPAEKSHTPLSLVLTMELAAAGDWPVLDALLVGASAYGHHKGFPSLPEADAYPDGHTLDTFAGGRMFRIIRRQIKTLNLELIEKGIGVSLSGVPINEKSPQRVKKFIRKRIMPALNALSLEEALTFRLKAQLVFSMLLEADKAFLAVESPEIYLNRTPRTWQSHWINQKIGSPPKSDVNTLRQSARKAVQEKIREEKSRHLNCLTAPTGLGKTLLAAEWALKAREQAEAEGMSPPKIIIVLPFLSIIEQTAGVFQSLLGFGPESIDGSWFLTSHSLSTREYGGSLEGSTESFFIDSWRTELVITTYDQFLMALADPKSRYQMRFHNLCDASIILDEVQSLPCRMWKLLNGLFRGMSNTCNTRFLLMSATLPPFIPDATPLLLNYRKYFNFRRYRFIFRFQKKTPLDSFLKEIGERLPAWLEQKERVLITLNTRGSARSVFEYLTLESVWPEIYSDIPIYFISADVTPKDRRARIQAIRGGSPSDSPCIVVSTQCVEAGVDIDMTRVIRDFGPWDSLVQIAGRCNREGLLADHLPVEIFNLANERGRCFSEMVYDPIHLSVTREIIGLRDSLGEEETLDLSEQYFHRLNNVKDTGDIHLKRFAYWQKDISIRELLRGEERQQHTFLVISQDQEMLQIMENINFIEDRWDRREGWRKLSGRMAEISVRVYARPGFRPEDVAVNRFNQWLLHEEYYDSEKGLVLSEIIDGADGGLLII